MPELEFFAEFFSDRPGRDPMVPEMVGSCQSWEDARQSAMDFATTDFLVRRVTITIDGKSETWVRGDTRWNQVDS